MKHNKFSLKTYDGLDLFAQEWLPEEGELRGIIILVHGIGEHSGRYAHLAEFFTAKNFGVVTYDHRGHGQSEGMRGFIPNYESFMKDLDLAFEYTQDNYKDIPVFVYAHSMGGNIGLNYILRRNPEIVASLISAPWLKLNFEPPKLLYKFGQVMSKVYPKFVVKGSVGKYNKVDEKEQKLKEMFANDPLNHDKLTAGLFFECEKAAKWAMENTDKLTKPMLIIHGDIDPLTSPLTSAEFATKSNLITHEILPGVRHEPHFDDTAEEVFEKVFEWFESRL